ncbi:MAG: ABC transporter ATP-binding protein [Acidimicrobiia bacterium]|nr:ABC transporter ATP-binding protein [Acidimicrobiia bacterium]
MITAEHVVKSWGPTAVLTDVSFDLGPGVTGLLGSNGAGKTTLIKLLLGLHDRDAGDLEVLGVDPESSGPELRQQVGFSPEHHHLPGDVHAADLVRHVAQLHGIPKRAAIQRASDVLWEVGLGEERFRPIGTMSTGQRQRVKLAQAIAHDPSLVVLDEPTDGLDPVQRDDMLELIRRIGSEFGIDILLSSHHLTEVEQICDQVVILADGSVRRSGSLRDLSGARAGLLVEVDSHVDLVAARLRDAHYTVEIDDGGRLVVEGEGAAVAVRNVVATVGAGLRRVQSRRFTLEDVFLEDQS